MEFELEKFVYALFSVTGAGNGSRRHGGGNIVVRVGVLAVVGTLRVAFVKEMERRKEA